MMERESSVNLKKGNIYGIVLDSMNDLVNTINKLDVRDFIINGFNLNKSIRSISSKRGSVLDNLSLYEFLTAKENLRYFAYLYDIDYSKVKEVINIIKLDISDKKVIKYYSLGMKQRLGIGVCLLRNVDTLVIESISGLEVSDVLDLNSLLNKISDRVVIIVGKKLSEVKMFTNNIIEIKNNKVALCNNEVSVNYDVSKKVLKSSDNLVNSPKYMLGESDDLSDILVDLMGSDD